MHNEDLFINRELSWIQFNKRVLEEGERQTTPLFERLRFLSIFQSNYEEFFRVRVGTLYDRMLLDDDPGDDKQGRTAKEQLSDIFKATKKLLPELDLAYRQLLKDGNSYIEHVSPEEVSPAEHAFLKQKFEKEIAPVISPFIVGKKHPFPFFANALRVVGVTLRSKNGGLRFGLIPIAAALPQIIFLGGGKCRFLLIEDLIALFAHKVFHKFEITESIVFSIIRNADIDENEGLYEYDVDYRRTMSKLIELRSKLAPVELKYVGKNCDKILNHLKYVLCLSKKQLFRQETPLNMGFLSQLERYLPREEYPELYYVPASPQYPAGLEHCPSLIDQMQKKDLLLSYPFDDIGVLIRLLEEAAVSDRVGSISITLYRVARSSKIVEALIDAARRGKSVSCMVELRARFDEENNIDWSKRLEDAGCRVFYGLPDYKVHCKLLIIGMTDGSPDLVQVGTGNFNESTARLYTDLALFTAHKGIVADAHKVFECLMEGRFVESSEHLLVAPIGLKPRLLALIDQEIEKKRAGKPCGITLKMNSLTDKALIDKLIEASEAGVKIRMIIRGICCLVPGVPGRTENIEVRSIVGRFLEHSRIYAFGAGSGRKFYISSADFMTRNTTQRVEVAVPVYDYQSRMKLAHILKLCLADNQQARVLRSDGHYRRPIVSARSKPVNMQSELYRDAYAARENAENPG